MKNKAIMLHHDYYEVIGLLNDEERGKLLLALFEYDINGKETDFADRTLLMLFKQMKKSLDTNREHYESTCKKRAESARKRWENNTEESKSMQTDANADNTNENTNANVNENEKGNEKENVNVKEKENAEPGGKANAEKEILTQTHTDKKAYGEFKNVFLSDEEYGKLRERSADYVRCIDSFSAYMKSSGKSYADHYAQLINWRLYGSERTTAPPLTPAKAKPPGERREPTFDVGEFTKKAVGIKYVPPEED